MTVRSSAFPPLDYPTGRALHHLLESAADRLGERIAIRFADEQTSYRELDGLSNAMAHLLKARGAGPGTRVALTCSNRPEFAVTVFAVLKLGASVVMISPAWKAAEVAHAVGLTRPSFAVVDGDNDRHLAAFLDPSAIVHLDRNGVSETLHLSSGSRPDVVLDWDATEAVLVFSSGTTGLPKAVRHSHASLAAASTHWCSALGLTAEDRFQITTPPFHILGLLNIFASVRAGSSVRLHPRFDLEAMLDAIESDRITLEMVVAPIALALANHPTLEARDLSSLRFIMWGATPVTASVAETVTARTGVRFLPAYGASELPVITANPVRRPNAWRLDSAGLTLHDVDVRIVDLESGTQVGPGGIGEIQARGPSMMVGYLPASADDEAFVDGWYRTGDVGWTEPDGWLHITDRVKEMIKVNGFQVAPAEIEAVLHSHDAVVDCAVFGVPDDTTGEAVVAAVTLGRQAALAKGELEALVADRLAPYKRLSRVHVVDEIPRLPSGKVLRRTLREQLGP